ncbi:MAG: hypothetical protein ACLQUZ_07680 [Rhizomicrobium sp.]
MAELKYLLMSCAVEAPIAFLIVRWTKWPGRGAIHAGLASAVATAVTHPQMWQAAIWAYPRFGYWPSVAALELLVVLVEGALIAWMAQLQLHRAMIVSLFANAGSCLFGLWLNG